LLAHPSKKGKKNSLSEFCLSVGVLFCEGDEQLLTLREAARGAQALLALQAGLVLRR
jgi:hypothetical protein